MHTFIASEMEDVKFDDVLVEGMKLDYMLYGDVST